MKTVSYCLLLIAAILSLAHNQCIINNPPPIKLDGSAVVCLHVYADSTYISSYAFKLNVDYFQSLVVNGMATKINQLANTYNSVTAFMQFQNTQKTTNISMEIYNKNLQRYRDILSFVIRINEGGFTQLIVDNANCDSIGSGDLCFENQAYTKTSNNKFGTLDPRFFVSWMGSDVDKNHCISHTKRLSRYSAFSVGSMYQNAKNIINA